MNVHQALAGALNHLKSISSGTLAFTKADGEAVSCTVYKSFSRQYNRDMQDSQYKEFDDMSVMATPSDVSTWNLIPNESQVTLDGVAYQVGSSIIKSPDHWVIWLRLVI